MKTLLLLSLLLITSCGTFKTSHQENRANCLMAFYDLGLNAEKAIESCEYVMKRE